MWDWAVLNLCTGEAALPVATLRPVPEGGCQMTMVLQSWRPHPATVQDRKTVVVHDS
jgi:hypothetical protein